MSNSKLPQKHIFASDPLILTFAKVPLRRDANVRIGPLGISGADHSDCKGRRLHRAEALPNTAKFAATISLLRSSRRFRGRRDRLASQGIGVLGAGRQPCGETRTLPEPRRVSRAKRRDCRNLPQPRRKFRKVAPSSQDRLNQTRCRRTKPQGRREAVCRNVTLAGVSA
jgi:hypothetical protein